MWKDIKEKFEIKDRKKKYGIICVWPYVLSNPDNFTNYFISDYYFSPGSHTLNSGQRKFIISGSAYDLYRIISKLLDKGYKHIKTNIQGDFRKYRYTINELENSEFPLHAVHWYFPYSDITVTITKNQLNNFIKDIKQLTEELDLLNSYREFKPDEGQFPDNYQFIAK